MACTSLIGLVMVPRGLGQGQIAAYRTIQKGVDLAAGLNGLIVV